MILTPNRAKNNYTKIIDQRTLMPHVDISWRIELIKINGFLRQYPSLHFLEKLIDHVLDSEVDG